METIGQQLSVSEWQTFYPTVDLANACKKPALQKVSQGYFCERCESLSQVKVPAGFFYCPHCLSLGRMTSQTFLYYFPAKKIAPRSVKLVWQGILSPAQEKIAQKLVADQAIGRTFLLWAVTGAGKTEMLFLLLKKFLEEGKRIAITAPRVDVCNELYLRFTQAFPQEAISLFHGQEKKEAGDVFVICTVHQLLRYQNYFDLVIVDEVDAFPYAQDPLLIRAVGKAGQATGQRVYLSATPSPQLKKSVDRLYHLPARYHRRPLPVPQLLFDWRLKQRLLKAELSKKAVVKLVELLDKNNLLLFCPSIPLLEKLSCYLQKKFPECQMTTVFAADQERLVKVENMRAGKYQLLLTTTILERGVTFENVSVVVLQASHRIFTQAALVQIAGRADRKGEYTQAEVIFITSEVTSAIKAAIKEIEENNRQARAGGLIDAL